MQQALTAVTRPCVILCIKGFLPESWLSGDEFTTALARIVSCAIHRAMTVGRRTAKLHP